MKREIKFRAWNGDTMNYNIIVGNFGAFWVNPGKNNNGLDENDNASLTPFNTKCSAETVIMQYTGLKDKNGKEIYEGDILTFDTGGKDLIFDVAWDERNAGFEKWMPRDMVIIIGNIYENPELLKQS